MAFTQSRNVASRIGQVHLLALSEDQLRVSKNGEVIGDLVRRGKRWAHERSGAADFPSQASAINSLIDQWPGVMR